MLSHLAIGRDDLVEAKRLAARFRRVLEDAKKDGMDEIIIQTKRSIEENPDLKPHLKKPRTSVS
ncbi:MAG: hypothetical protein ACE5Z5_12920 [Candidatus Bathyarchaeia archaeon]